MALFPNTQENNQRARKNLKAHGYSEQVIDEVIDTISTMDRTKDNLGVGQLHESAIDKIKFIETVYDEGIKVFAKYLRHLNTSQFTLNKAILAKYKSNICKYLYIIAVDHKGIDQHESNFIKDSFGTLKRTDKILNIMDRFESYNLGKKEGVFILRDRTLNNPGQSITWTPDLEEKTGNFIQQQVTGIPHNEPVVVSEIDGGYQLSNEMKREAGGTHKSGTSFSAPLGSGQIAAAWNIDSSKQ